MALPPYDPNFTMKFSSGSDKKFDYEFDEEHDESVSAAVVAVELISSARLSRNLDSVRTEYSARYLLDNNAASPNLTVRACLEFAIKNGLPKAEDWPLLGSSDKQPPPSYKPPLVTMKGEVVEPDDMDEARELLKHQSVGAKVHIFSPHVELQQGAIYCGSSGEPATYMGLRDGIITGVEKFKGKSIAVVKVWYKKKFIFLKVAMSRMFYDGYLDIGPTILLVNFCAPRLSIK
uniref:Uncharacterized protein n=2 Tax=Noccaea caerulescens TaxID=107243 RepID=A0A1J3EAI3_NOCCA